MLNKIRQNIYPLSLLSLLFLTYAISFFFNGIGSDPLLLPIIVGLLFIVIVLNVLSKDFKWQGYKLHYVMLLYCFYLLISPYFHNAFDVSRLTTWVLALTPLSYFAIASLQMSRFKGLHQLIKISYFLTGTLLAGLGLIGFLYTQQRTSAVIYDTNVYAVVLLTFLLPLIAFYFLRDRRKSRFGLLSLCLIFIFLCALFATYSRAVMALLIITSIGLLLVLKKSGLLRLKSLLAVVSVLFLAQGAVKFYPDTMITRNISVQGLIEDNSIGIRLLMNKVTLNAWVDSGAYLTGTGFGSFKAHYFERRTAADMGTSGNYAHNDYVQFLLEGGLIQLFFIALISIYILYYLFVFYLKLTQKNESTKSIVIVLSLLLGVSALLMHALVNFVFYMVPLAIFIGAVLGIAVNYTHPPESSEVKLAKKTKISMSILFGIAFFYLCIDIYISKNYFVTVVNLDKTAPDSVLFKRATNLRILRPRSFGLARFQSIYLYKNVERYGDKEDTSLVKEAYEREVIRTLNLNNRDAPTFSYLAIYAFVYPERYQAMRLNSDELKNINNSKELLKKSIQYDPTILLNYSLLVGLLNQDEYQSFYELVKEKLHRRPVLHGNSAQDKVKTLDLLIKFSDQLNICDDLPIYEDDKKVALETSQQVYSLTKYINCPNLLN